MNEQTKDKALETIKSLPHDWIAVKLLEAVEIFGKITGDLIYFQTTIPMKLDDARRLEESVNSIFCFANSISTKGNLSDKQVLKVKKKISELAADLFNPHSER